MSESLGLGKIIETPQHRDAIHIAVVPVIAGELLYAGQRVGLKQVVARAAGNDCPYIGVVDPFLRQTVYAGQQFWLFLEPGSITSLRHEWTHPILDAKEVPPQVPDAKNAAMAWMEEWAKLKGLTCEEAMSAGARYLKHGEYLNEGARFEGECVEDDYWERYEILRGTKVAEGDRGSFFSCSC